MQRESISDYIHYVRFLSVILLSMMSYGVTQNHMNTIENASYTTTFFNVPTVRDLLIPLLVHCIIYQPETGLFSFHNTALYQLLESLYKIPAFWFSLLLLTTSISSIKNTLSYLSYIENYSTYYSGYTEVLYMNHANYLHIRWCAFNLTLLITVIVPICSALITLKALHNKLKA